MKMEDDTPNSIVARNAINSRNARLIKETDTK